MVVTMFKKYDSFFLLFSIINFFISFLCIITFNIPVEVHNYYDFTLSENLNNVYMSGKRWTIENGLYMLFTGLGCIGIIWLTEMDLKIDFMYCGLRYRLKRCYNYTKGLYRR
jgi:hypothetical protein